MALGDRHRQLEYAIGGVAAVCALLLRWPLDPYLGNDVPFVTFFPAVVAASLLAGQRGGLTAAILGAVFAWYFLIAPRFSFAVDDEGAYVRLLVYLVASGLIAGFSGGMLAARQRALRAEADTRREQERLRVMVASIGDALLTTSADGRVTFMNPVAEQLTGWTSAEALGRPLDEVLRIVDETTREPVANPVQRVQRDGPLVGLAEHTLLLARDGAERPIDDSAAQILAADGTLEGCVLVFRDVSERRRAERALRRSEEFHRAIAEMSTDFAFSARVEDDGAIVTEAVTEGFGRLLGFTVEEVNARGGWQALVHPEDAPQAAADLERLRAGEVVEGTMRQLTRDGHVVWLAYRTTPVRDARGHVVHLYGSARDITAQREAESKLRDSEERFRMLADHMAPLAWTADANGWLTWFNRRWFEYTGATLADVQVRGWHELVHPEHLSRVLGGVRRAVATGEVWDDTFLLRSADGQYRWFLARAVPSRDERGKVQRWFGTATDVSVQREAEETLRSADKRKDEFLATLAHELRNPLAPIRSSIEIMKRAAGDPALTGPALATMDRQMAHLVRLVDDLLDISRISRDKLELQRSVVALASVLEPALEACRPLVDGARQALTVTLPAEPVWLDGDPVRLTQVFSNLLHNATKYTPPGGRIALSAERTDGTVRVSVRDSGVGIAAEVAPHIFDMFTQAELLAEHARGGLGIGLSLVRRLVEMHGGTVHASSAGPGEGSEFVVELPVVAAPARPATTADAPTGGPARRRILVVDDNVDAADSLALLLELAGHETRLAHDGPGALAAAEEFRPDVALLDIGLTGFDGNEVARRLRAAPWGRDVLLVALTGWGQDDDRRRSQDAGFDHHLVKPVEHETVLRLLERGGTRPVALRGEAAQGPAPRAR